ncbi:hypothetical protein DYB37_000711 [Aphanomyces astaci]|nr:hypothetical protein DYB36_008729 [Aphanomyces astaci]RHY14084.1 hypothetical protein DYB25_004740 [Aphanomyces astaci]RHY46374.1 hypothetical protein DYB38_000110 [Aphanomyces astaci]RHY52723.1 hypothetical protein DYB30_001765 [Aphanomyces astaci]RHY58876.1 hypothetical protein DYB34_000824 [Aphanomyces astaci]
MNVGKAQSLDMSTISSVIIVTNIAAISITLIEAVREKYLERKRFKQIRKRKYQNDLRYHVQRLWWRAMTYAVAEVYLQRRHDDPSEDVLLPSFRVVLELARRQRAATDRQVVNSPPPDEAPVVPIIDANDVLVVTSTESKQPIE